MGLHLHPIINNVMASLVHAIKDASGLVMRVIIVLFFVLPISQDQRPEVCLEDELHVQ